MMRSINNGRLHLMGESAASKIMRDTSVLLMAAMVSVVVADLKSNKSYILVLVNYSKSGVWVFLR